ncbi:hypothetical protein PC121_g17869 [Phytophthora cactorum]|nr:hypothetical protein PC121_g17869 [Phytophthora cactorum]
MPSGAPFSNFDVVRSPPVDLEMLSELLIFQGLELASEFKGYAIDATQGLLSRYHQIEGVEGVLLDAGSRLWCWLRQRLRPGGTTKKEQLPFPLPAVFPLTLQHMDYITERFDDVKTQLQLIYAALDDLHTKRDHTDSKLSRLHEQLRRVPTCRCERSMPSSLSFEALVKEKTCSHNTKALEKRLVDFRGETPVLQVDRLEVPLELAKPPTTLREDSSAILYWIIKAVDMDRGTSKLEGDESGHRVLQHPQPNAVATAPNTARGCLASEQHSAEQEELELQDNTDTEQQSAMDIAQLYQEQSISPLQTTVVHRIASFPFDASVASQ